MVVRLLRDRFGGLAYVVSYLFWIVSFVAGLAFTSWSGLELYGFDRTDLWQVVGAIVFFISPFGLPLLFGAPVVIVADAIRAGRNKFKRPHTNA